MKFTYVLYSIGLILIVLGVAQFLSSSVALYYREGQVWDLLISGAITAFCGLVLRLRYRQLHDPSIKDSYGIVVFGWIASCIFGALPFIITQTLNPVDSFFETVSGFTTTGASVFSDVERLPRCILFWRALIQWIGGMGIILMVIILLPFLESSGMQMLRTEVSVISQRIRPRMRDTGVLLFKVYLLFTFVGIILLKIFGMSWFDAFCHTLTTLSTGGFSTRNASIGQFNNIFIELIIILFMAIGAMNFTLHFKWLSGDFKSLLKDSEFKYFVGIILLAMLFIAAGLTASGITFDVAIRKGIFQSMSIITATGHTTVDFSLWPNFPKMIIFFLMFVGGCVGSTAGAIKVKRFLIVAKSIVREIKRMILPSRVIKVKVDSFVIEEDIISRTITFILLYMVIFLVAGLVLLAQGLTPSEAFSASASCFGNVGPAFGSLFNNYSTLNDFSTFMLSILMLVGRLEIFCFIVLFSPVIWRRTL